MIDESTDAGNLEDELAIVLCRTIDDEAPGPVTLNLVR
jgi:hypothetical protein